MLTARNFWKKKYKDFNDDKFNSVIQCKLDIASVWHLDHQRRIVDGYRQRLTGYGLKEAI
jgi:hypothetical protein